MATTRSINISTLALMLGAVVLSHFAMHAFAGEPAVGTLSGTVTDANGQPAAGVVIAFFGDVASDARRGRGGVNGGQGKSADFQVRPEQLAKSMPKGKATSDASGKFEIKTLPAGKYTFRAGSSTNKAGVKVGEVTVEAGKSVTLDIKLEPAPAK